MAEKTQPDAEKQLATIRGLLGLAAPAVRKARSTGQPGLDAALMTVMDAADVAGVPADDDCVQPVNQHLLEALEVVVLGLFAIDEGACEEIDAELTADEYAARGLLYTGRDISGEGVCTINRAGIKFVRGALTRARTATARLGRGESPVPDIGAPDLTRMLLEALELPCDDPDNPSAQMAIQSTIEGWLATTCVGCKRQVASPPPDTWAEEDVPGAGGDYVQSRCPSCQTEIGGGDRA